MSEQHAPFEARDAERLAYAARLEVFLESRHGSHAIAMDATRTGDDVARLVDAAARVADFVDDAIGIVHQQFKPRLECQEGCCSCCMKPGVLVSVAETLRLLGRVRETFSADDLAALAGRARQYAAATAGPSPRHKGHSVPCPLLVDRRCSVYDVRPLVCRGYNSTNRQACLDAERDGGDIVPIFAPIKDASDGSAVGLAQALAARGLDEALLDLGLALDALLNGVDGLTDTALLNGVAALGRSGNRELLPALWDRVREVAHSLHIDAIADE